eukprot:scaffold1411_cov252-Pinguiococcus_pyrenoidosus.AAC.27
MWRRRSPNAVHVNSSSRSPPRFRIRVVLAFPSRPESCTCASRVRTGVDKGGASARPRKSCLAEARLACLVDPCRQEREKARLPGAHATSALCAGSRRTCAPDEADAQVVAEPRGPRRCGAASEVGFSAPDGLGRIWTFPTL